MTEAHDETGERTARIGYTGQSSRRDFLKMSAVAAGIAPNIGLVSGTNNGDEIKYPKYFVHTNHEEVKKGAPPIKEPYFDTMSETEWGKIHTARVGSNKTWDIIRSNVEKPIKGIFVEVRTLNEKYDKEIVVDYRRTDGETEPNVPYEKLVSVLPEEIEGEASPGQTKQTFVDTFTMRVEKTEFSYDDCSGDHYDSSYGTDIPGACEISPGSGRCTSASPAYNHNLSDTVLLSAGHCFSTNDYMYQPVGSQTKNGDCIESYDCAAQDFCEIKAKNGANFQYSFSDDSGGYEGDIVGTHSWTSIQNMEQNSDSITKRGATTGGHVGYVDSTGTGSCDGSRYFNVDDVESKGGDSGGPHFTANIGIEDFDITIAGIHSGSFPGTCPDTKANAKYIGDAEGYLNVSV